MVNHRRSFTLSVSILSYLILSYLILSYLILSYLILYILSYLILSWPYLDLFLILSRSFWPYLLSPILSYPILSYPILSLDPLYMFLAEVLIMHFGMFELTTCNSLTVYPLSSLWWRESWSFWGVTASALGILTARGERESASSSFKNNNYDLLLLDLRLSLTNSRGSAKVSSMSNSGWMVKSWFVKFFKQRYERALTVVSVGELIFQLARELRVSIGLMGEKQEEDEK